MTVGDNGEPIFTGDEINRLWHHGLHEERLFHDRLNYFTILQMGLLTICGIMYNKETSLGFFVPLTVVALLLTLLWMLIQSRHWAYCRHVTSRVRRLVPEFRLTIDEFSEGNWERSFFISKLLALAIPALFACCWIFFLCWLLVRPTDIAVPTGVITFERVAIAILGFACVWLLLKLKRLERNLRRPR